MKRCCWNVCSETALLLLLGLAPSTDGSVQNVLEKRWKVETGTNMSKKVWSVVLGGLLVGAFVLFWTHPKRECVNIYDWYGVLPQTVLDKFEDETGIRIHYDVFDNNETLDAKLLASNSGYDIVFPSVTPYGARHLNLGVYQKLNKAWLPNLRPIDSVLQSKLAKIDPDMDYFLPYYYGTTGIAFDEATLEKVIPDVPKDGYHLLFDPDIVQKLAPYGISLLQEPVDVFPPFMAHIGIDPSQRSLEDLWNASKRLQEICRFVRRFSASRFVVDLVMGDVCIAQSWSGEAIKAIEDARKLGKRIRYIIPRQGADIWIDAAAIPVGAPHVRNAHAFLNFLLRPDISAEITNHCHMATMVLEARSMIEPKILNNPLVFPPKDVLERLRLSPAFVTPKDLVYERVMMRLWAQIKMQRDMTRAYFVELVKKQEARIGKPVSGEIPSAAVAEP